MTPPFEQLRQQLTAELGRAPDGRIWKDIVNFHGALLSKIERGQASIQDLRRLYAVKDETYERIPHKQKATKHEHTLAGDLRLQALVRIAAADAEREGGGVQWIRNTLLGGTLLAPDTGARWLRELAAEQDPQPIAYVGFDVGGPEEWLPDCVLCETLAAFMQDASKGPGRLTTPFSVEWDRELCATWLENKARAMREGKGGPPPRAYAAERLCFWDDEAEGYPKAFVLVGVSGRLRLLKDKVTQLLGSVPWDDEADAVDFILTGTVAPLPLAHLTAIPAHLPALSRLEMKVDPRLGPREVSSLYSEGRAEFVEGRDKPMQEKHIELAVFCAEQLTSTARWHELRTQWNERFPQWSFEESDPMARRFARDARAAYKRVVGLDLSAARKEAMESGPRIRNSPSGGIIWSEPREKTS